MAWNRLIGRPTLMPLLGRSTSADRPIAPDIEPFPALSSALGVCEGNSICFLCLDDCVPHGNAPGIGLALSSMKLPRTGPASIGTPL
jgi:hypothetical protein